MKTPRHELADVLGDLSHELLQIVNSNTWKARTLYALKRCRTSAMGGHLDKCMHPDCGKLHISYNSCRNRHCPKCQGHLQQQWTLRREADLINTSYFHVVFTLPDHLNELALHQPKLFYNLLFSTAWGVIRDFGANPKMLGAKMGMIAVLHTWGQNLSLHPHLHCIVPAGGITTKGKWKTARSKGRFLFPVKAMGKVFRARFVEGLRKQGVLPRAMADRLFAKPWVIYAKRPFFGPRQVIGYLGRYTHKIAISNSRILDISHQQVSYQAKDYRQGAMKVILKLHIREFVRRFALHILPKGFTRIRHYGLLNGRVKKVYKASADRQLGKVPLAENLRPISMHRICPVCKKGNLQTLAIFDSRGPPTYWLYQLQGHPTERLKKV